MKTSADIHRREEADLREELVTHLMQAEGRVVVVENVPARVNQVTGERLFSLATTDWLYHLAHGVGPTPARTMPAEVYLFAARTAEAV